MVLFSSLNIALTGLQANIAALQTIGHNLSNANTPGFSRQDILLQPRTQKSFSFGQVGTGVNVTRVRRLVDFSLEDRMRSAASTMGSLAARTDALQQLESLFNALSDQDLGAQMDRFFQAIDDLANNPDNLSARTQVLENARTLSESMNFLAGRIRDTRELLNNEVLSAVDEVNRITSELADLNRQILLAENGGIDIEAANDLRDQRDLLLRELSGYLDIRAVETSNGEMNVLV
ncbi:MAG: flagellar hook-associated protein FlgK, partial [Planctomycetota bacterium]